MFFQMLIIFEMSISAAGAGFYDALSQQMNPKSLDLITLDWEQADFDRQKTSSINKILQVQIGQFYNQYKSKSNMGLFSTRRNRAYFQQKLMALFGMVKNETKTRLKNSYTLKTKNTGMIKGVRSRHKLYVRRHNLYQSYLRS